MPFKCIYQHDIKDCGAAALSMICRHYGLKLPLARFRECIGVDSNGASIYGIVCGAKSLGLKAYALKGSADELICGVKNREFALPFIAHVLVGGILEHYVVVYKVTKKHFYVADPGEGKVKYSYKRFFEIWQGHIIAFEKDSSFIPRDECVGKYSRFMRLPKKEKGLTALLCVVSFLMTAIGFAGAFVFKLIMQCVENQNDISALKSLGASCLAIIGLYAFQAVLEVVRGYLLGMMSKKITFPLLRELHDHMTEIPVSRLNERKTAELMSRFSDAESLATTLSGSAVSVVLDTLTVALCGILLYTLSAPLFFLTFAAVLLYVLVVFLFMRPLRLLNEKETAKSAELAVCTKENIESMETAKVFGAEKMLKRRFSKKIGELVKINMRGSVIYSLQSALCGLVTSCGVIVLLWYGTELVLNGNLSLATLLTFYALFGYYLSPIERLTELQPRLQAAAVAAERLNDIFDTASEIESENKALPNGELRVEGLSFRYGMRELVLDDISFNVSVGESVAFVGESGSGKTTLAKLLLNFYTPESGKIYIGNNDISCFSPQDIRKSFAYVSQEPFLFSDTVRNNLICGNDDISDEEIKKACALAHADRFINKLPHGYDTYLAENGRDLSGGQKQRLAIARALLKKPKILILDEATGNLDTVTEQSIRRAIDSLKGKITCIIIAHRLSTIKNCDRIYVFENGKIVESGTHEELLAQNGKYTEFIKS